MTSTVSERKPVDFTEISLAPITLDDGGNEPFIFTTLRYDPLLTTSPENTASSFNRPCPFYLLEHQWTRLQIANRCTSFYRSREPSNGYGGPSNFLYGLLGSVNKWRDSNPDKPPEAMRIKVRAYTSGRNTTEIQPLPRIPLDRLFKHTLSTPDELPKSEWTVVLDLIATGASESTIHKTSDRLPYERARAMAGIASFTSPNEVLLYNTDGNVLDGSTSTPIFYRNDKWVTPASSSGGLQGTTRRWALEKGLCVEGIVSKDSLVFGEIIWFSNAVKGFFHATLVPRDAGLVAADTKQCLRTERKAQS